MLAARHLRTQSAFAYSRILKRCYSDHQANELRVSLTTPHQVYFTDRVVPSVTLPGSVGDFGVAQNHVPTVSMLRPGLVVIHTTPPEKVFVAGGFAFIHADSSCVINAIEVMKLEDLDLSLAKEAVAKATVDMNSGATDLDKAKARIIVELNQSIVDALTQ